MLTELQARAAKLMAANRAEASYFAGGAVLNEHTARLSDDLDVFHDGEDRIDEFCRRDIKALEANGLEVHVDIDIWGCVEARVRDESRRETIIQWMAETRNRFFPLVRDSLWGLRLHRADLAVNKSLAASMRGRARDIVDLMLIERHFCSLGPLFLAASVKMQGRSPVALLDMARHRLVMVQMPDIAVTYGLSGDCTAETVKPFVTDALNRAEVFLDNLPDAMLDGLPVNAEGVPVDRMEDMVHLRPVADGGGRFPDFPDTPPSFLDGPCR